jgi:hypothetical protein
VLYSTVITASSFLLNSLARALVVFMQERTRGAGSESPRFERWCRIWKGVRLQQMINALGEDFIELGCHKVTSRS